MESWLGEGFLLGLLQVLFINLVLSGDNAVVIALACRNLEPVQQRKAVFWGSFGAIVLRIVLTVAAVWILRVPFVQAAGGILLIFLALQLIKGDDGHDKLKSGTNIGEAIRTIIIADLVMSLDNVVAVAGAAGGNLLLIVAGLAISIPLIIWGSQLLMSLMNRFPIIVYIGAGLLGYTAGEMIVTDKAIQPILEPLVPGIEHIAPVLLAVIVILLGLRAKRTR
ncbi:TerC family protein [Paenibacillus gansuensis]|uniref:TerC family protein n=1 Tax=Paenibacillus gansuensis TaxID=306542 RepID=A0ABW5P7E2_9BACL